MTNHKDVPEFSAIMEEMTNQIMKERNLSRKDAEGACRLTLWTEGHFQRLKDAILWDLDQEKRWGRDTRLTYSDTDIAVLVKATGMGSETILEAIFNMVDDFLFYLNQSKLEFRENPALNEYGRREVALVKRLNLDVRTHFDPLARIATRMLLAYGKEQESATRRGKSMGYLPEFRRKVAENKSAILDMIEPLSD